MKLKKIAFLETPEADSHLKKLFNRGEGKKN